MLIIVAAHVAGLAALMSARPDLVPPPKPVQTIIDFIDPVKPEPVDPIPTELRPAPSDPITAVTPIVPGPAATDPVPPVPLPLPGPSVDPVPAPRPAVEPAPVPDPVRFAARLITPRTLLEPPYPSAKLASGEEAVLRLRLSIATDGRVIAVEPIGRADPAFLASARRHILARWRYRPASEDGRPVTSEVTVTVRFQLDA
jgi:protein TonB